jgi:hypothetical protein
VVRDANIDVDYALTFLGKNFINSILEADEGEVDKFGRKGGLAHFNHEYAEGGLLECVIYEEGKDRVCKFVSGGLNRGVKESTMHLGAELGGTSILLVEFNKLER